MTVKTIACTGSDYPMGVLQGRLLKDQINDFWKQVENSRQLEFVKPKLLPKSIHILHCQKKADTFLKNYLQKVMPEQGERIHGISQGCGLPVETLFFLQALELELLTKIDTFSVSSGIGLLLTRDKTINSSLLMGFNYDHSFNLGDQLIVRQSRPRSHLQSVEVTLSFLAGSLGGINEAGLTIMLVPAYTNDGISLKTIPVTILIQKALESCRSIEEALKIFHAYNRDMGGTILLADSKANYQIIEFSRNKLAELKVNSPIGVFTSQLEELKGEAFESNAKWSNKAWDPFKGLSIYESPQARRKRALDLLNDNSLLDIEDLQSALLDQQDKGENSLCRQGDIITTQLSVLISPTDGKIFVTNPQWEAKGYKTFSLE